MTETIRASLRLIRTELANHGIDLDLDLDIDLPFVSGHPYQVEGTGLGLSISHVIVDNHRGRIRCERSSEEGTPFQVAFPVTSHEES